MHAFGRRLKDERRAREWTIPALSRRSGLPVSTLYSLEKDGRRPREGTLLALARAFELEPAELDAWDQVAA